MAKEKLIKNKALQLCLEAKEIITPNRASILDLLIKNNKPLAAYELKEMLKDNNKGLNISTIYRVLDFWIKLKVVHKLSFLNKYVLCSNPDEVHTHITNICTKCSSVVETCNENMGLNLKESTKNMGVALTPDLNVEIPVLCANCK
ncbi:MAG: transcriptional repressor [Pelagibacterales bacterium]|nr:transcriptional repressor [Pelagibacterales bacterium]